MELKLDENTPVSILNEAGISKDTGFELVSYDENLVLKFNHDNIPSYVLKELAQKIYILTKNNSIIEIKENNKGEIE